MSAAVERYLLPPEGTDYRSLAAYRLAGGYQASDQALRQLSPAAVIEQVKESGLRGRGGAGFSTGQKWSFMPKPGGAKPSYIACNGDESEPGTFKDRQILERNPHLLLESLIIAGHANRRRRRVRVHPWGSTSAAYPHPRGRQSSKAPGGRASWVPGTSGGPGLPTFYVQARERGPFNLGGKKTRGWTGPGGRGEKGPTGVSGPPFPPRF